MFSGAQHWNSLSAPMIFELGGFPKLFRHCGNLRKPKWCPSFNFLQCIERQQAFWNCISTLLARVLNEHYDLFLYVSLNPQEVAHSHLFTIFSSLVHLHEDYKVTCCIQQTVVQAYRPRVSEEKRMHLS